MNNSIDKNIQRIQRLKLSCSIKDGDNVRRFHNGHEYVEIGGIKWATCNVGAENPFDSGLYFAWGETEGYTQEQVGNGENQKHFIWGDYKYRIVGGEMFKYNSRDQKYILEPSDDAVTANWGNGWRMPRRGEFSSLIDSTISKWVTDYQGSGINGMMFVDKADHSMTLFFPAFGYCIDSAICYMNEGLYLSSVLQDLEYPCLLNVLRGAPPHLVASCSCCRGLQVRGVVAE